MNKYEMFGEANEQGLRRIKALRDFGDVKIGDVGGWIESEKNLSHDGDCWVYGDALVFGDAQVYDDARVSGNALVYDDARVSGNALVFDDARVFDDACIYDNARVFDDACIYDNARVSSNARVYGNARVSGDACVSGDAHVSGNAQVSCDDDFCTFGKFGSENRATTAFKDSKIGIRIVCGCFTGSLDEFREAIKKTHGDSKHGKTYMLVADAIEMKLS